MPTSPPASSVWAIHMKTMIDLLARSKALARRENPILKALIEEGLQRALLARSSKPVAAFAVQPFEGDGLNPDFATAGWEKIRDEIHRDRG
jgi:hypothetical protein